MKRVTGLKPLKKYGNVAFLAAAVTIFIIGCGGSGGTTPTIINGSAADQAILNRLIAINPQGISAFTLPDSTSLSQIPQDPNNPLTPEKIALGQLLFHETGLMKFPARPQGQESASCASCHHASAGFQANRFQGIGEGGVGFGSAGEGRIPDPTYPEAIRDTQPIRTPSAMNGAYQLNHHWNGQFGATGANIGTESQWTPGTSVGRNSLGFQGIETQAIAGMSIHRLAMDKTIADEFGYTSMFDAAFPTEPIGTRYTLITAGLAIAAYERTLLPSRAPWQLWLKGDLQAMTEPQKTGAELFFGKAKCFNCHSGPALSENNFRAVGFRDLYQRGDANNANANVMENKGRGGFTGRPQDNFKFKTPQLYNLADSPHYGHGSSIFAVREVIEYFNAAIPQNPTVPTNQLDPLFKPLGLTTQEINSLTDFVLNALRDPDLDRYTPNSVLSGNPFPNNDP